MTKSLWDKPDGNWTIASFVVRSLCQSSDLMPAEVYFILTSLEIECRFHEYWKHDQFFVRAGLPKQASKVVDRKRDGWIALTGDHAWAAGDIDKAKRQYEHSIASGDSSVIAGLGGLLRLHFVMEDYDKCIEYFRRGCPPHQFYVEYRELFNDGLSNDHGNWSKQSDKLKDQYPGTSQYFLSQAKYMCRVIVVAALHASGIDNELRQMIGDYFEIDDSDVDQLAKAVTDNDKELLRLRKLLTPKRTADRSLDSLRAEGDTERAQRLCELIPQSAGFVTTAALFLDDYLRSGDATYLDEMIIVGSPFGIASADGLVLAEILESRNASIAKNPVHRLALMRRFNTICDYPGHDFLDDYLEVMGEIRAEIEPGDVIAAILNLQWYKTRYQIDETGPGGTRGGLGKTEISYNREWLEIALRDHPEVFDREQWTDRRKAVRTLHHAYLFLRERQKQVRSDERWVSEALLGDALSTIFGKNEVVRHARPLWLSPQHLDFFLPRFGLAVEYMGAQHYVPVEVFGGKRALEETKVRDERKRALCERMAITLIYVTHEEDIGRRAKEIYREFSQCSVTATQE